MVTRVPKSLSRVVLAVCILLACFIAPQSLHSQSSSATAAAPSTREDDPDRPILKHQLEPIPKRVDSELSANVEPHSAPLMNPSVADGLALPATGYLWALDNFDGKPQLVQLKYVFADVNSHGASNWAKVQVAPFIYKPKVTWEIKGAAAGVRLHLATPTIFIRARDREVEENAADVGAALASLMGNLALVRVKVRGETRIVSTIAFTQVTVKAERSEEIIETVREHVGNSNWYKLVPKEPLAAGEYALVRLSQRQNTFSPMIFDFAIDPNAAQNSPVIVGKPVIKD